MLLLVLELMEEELFDRIMDKKKFTELEVESILRDPLTRSRRWGYFHA